MPAVFSPGEAETRPLDPEAIVYTTAQKVADLLGIGPGEAVLIKTDTATDGVYVTGADYRDHGFVVGDSVTIYSDNDPLGFTITVDSIESSSSGVKLVFDDTFPAGKTNADYTVALNTYVQNQASFTNGKTRGVTRDHVEQRIKEVQDKIDNITHNAWRPSIVTAEYINFDTYKPYRRRYYTDYVGTSPLLFRNVQQMLRIELWQGDDYREVGAAEVRLKVEDYASLTGANIYLCPGGGGFGQLAAGSSTRNWEAAFNNMTTAQNIADLINKEDRVGRQSLPFNTQDPYNGLTGTTYTQPISSGDKSIYINNEFLATANSDYGGGKLKLTSMKGGNAGETCTIAITDDGSNLAISQSETFTISGTTPASPVYGFTMAVTDASNLVDYGLLQAANGLVIGYTSKSGNNLLNCQKLSGTLNADTTYEFTQHQFKTDLIGSTTGDQARRRDWWIDNEMGIVYFNNSYPYFEWNAIKVSYIYGERYLEKAIEEVATKMVATELLMADDRSVLIPEGTQNVDLASKIQLWRTESEKILSRYKEIVVFA